jgi:hypothetical protein
VVTFYDAEVNTVHRRDSDGSYIFPSISFDPEAR